jgi:hypothetical protein
VRLQSARLSRLGAGVATAALIGAAVLVPTSTAHAYSAPTISELICNDQGYGDYNKFICTMTISGGVSPYTSEWQAGANVTGFYYPSISYALGYCVVGQYAEVSVNVSDDVGEHVEASAGFACD